MRSTYSDDLVMAQRYEDGRDEDCYAQDVPCC